MELSKFLQGKNSDYFNAKVRNFCIIRNGISSWPKLFFTNLGQLLDLNFFIYGTYYNIFYQFTF